MRIFVALAVMLSVGVTTTFEDLTSKFPMRFDEITRVIIIPVPEVTVTVVPPEIPLGTAYVVAAELGLDEDDLIELHRISAYNPVPRQTVGDPTVSRCGPNKPKQIALSRDYFFSDGVKHLCGATVTLITNRGDVFEDYVIWDTLNARYDTTVDILFPEVDESGAFAFGITTGLLYIH